MGKILGKFLQKIFGKPRLEPEVAGFVSTNAPSISTVRFQTSVEQLIDVIVIRNTAKHEKAVKIQTIKMLPSV